MLEEQYVRETGKDIPFTDRGIIASQCPSGYLISLEQSKVVKARQEYANLL